MNEMKKIYYLAAALTVLAIAVSCEKNTETTQPQQSGGYRQVTIKAGTVQTRTSVSNGVLTWSANDKLNIVPQSGTVAAAALDIKTGVGAASGTFEGQIDASIEDGTDLYGWCGGCWTYNSGSFSVDMPSAQTYVANGLAENAYPSIGTGTIASGITLSNPMGVLKLTVKGASSDLVKSISVTSAANNLAGGFTVNPASSYAVSGGSSKTVTLNVAEPYVALSATGVNFYVVVPPATYAASDLTVKVTFSNDEYLSETFSDAVTVTASNATSKEITVSDDKTGRRGTLNGKEYVLIRAKYDGENDTYLKWATQNLAVTESGKQEWKPNGTGTDYIIGDYFQWAAYDGYLSGTKPGNLVVYTSFTNTCTGGASNAFTFKDSKKFGKASAPYSGTSYSKYTGTGEGKDGKTKLEQSDDVANIVLGSPWRIPTGGSAGEFKAMKEATKWTWDDTGKGYYVTKSSEDLASDKSNALLFFPAAGDGSGTDLDFAGDFGYYWSSSLYTVGPGYAFYLRFGSLGVDPDYHDYRSYGFSVRPVSD